MLEVGGVGGIEERTEVRVAVPDVPVDPGFGPVAAGEPRKEFDELRDAVARDDRVFHEPPRFARTGTLDDRREDGPTHLPERRLANRVERDLRGLAQPITGADAPDHAVRDRGEVPVIELDEEHRLCRRRNPARLSSIRRRTRSNAPARPVTSAHWGLSRRTSWARTEAPSTKTTFNSRT